MRKNSNSRQLLNFLRGKSTFTFLLKLFSIKWKKDHNYYILTTKYINTNIEASYILMYNIVYICATIYKQSKSNKKRYFYMMEIDLKSRKSKFKLYKFNYR
jgi:hypothetical protein